MFRSSVLYGAALFVAVSAAAAPAKWTVDPAKSSLSWAVTVNGQAVTGAFPAFGALIAFDSADLAHSSAKITVDMTAVKSGDSTRDAMLLKPDWYNVLDFPQAVFQTTSFVAKGGDKYDAVGTLTLKGVTKPLTLPLTIKISGNGAVATGDVILKRREFNVGASKDFAADSPVALSVKVMVNVTAKRAN
ncbi:MAG: YceI family protein [Alphaproteobacteria bacterium]|nr:YceI family protein [Alphaproteobacteria bacterium]